MSAYEVGAVPYACYSPVKRSNQSINLELETVANMIFHPEKRQKRCFLNRYRIECCYTGGRPGNLLRLMAGLSTDLGCRTSLIFVPRSVVWISSPKKNCTSVFVELPIFELNRAGTTQRDLGAPCPRQVPACTCLPEFRHHFAQKVASHDKKVRARRS